MDTLPSPQANTRLRQARILRNWRQVDLAEQLGTTVASIKRWERGSHQPSAYYRIKLCTLFAMSSQELGLIVEPSTSGQAALLPASSDSDESPVRLFVSYLMQGDEPGALSAQRLLADVRARGAEVVIDDQQYSQEPGTGYLRSQMMRCDYFILIQTPQALRSPDMQQAVSLAVQLVAEQHMTGVLRFLITPSESKNEPSLWSTLPVVDASQDYLTARNKLLRAVGLFEPTEEEDISTFAGAGLLPKNLVLSAATDLDQIPTRPENRLDVRPPARTFMWTDWRGRSGILIGVILCVLILSGVLVTIDAGRNSVANSNTARTPGPGRQTATPAVINPQGIINPYSTDSTLLLKDDLTGEATDASQWTVTTDDPTYGCFFRKQAYDMVSRGLNYCVADSTNIGNFVYQIQCSILQGHAAGIIFRTNDDAQTYYIFEVTVDGKYFVQRNDSSEADAPLLGGNSPVIHTGFNRPNLLAVDANGGQLTFYINGINITGSRPLTDTHYSSGKIGVIVGEQDSTADSTIVTEATYLDARVWI